MVSIVDCFSDATWLACPGMSNSDSRVEGEFKNISQAWAVSGETRGLQPGARAQDKQIQSIRRIATKNRKCAKRTG